MEARIHRRAVNPGQQHVDQIVAVPAFRLRFQIAVIRFLSVHKRKVSEIVMEMPVATGPGAVERLLLRRPGMRPEFNHCLRQPMGWMQVAKCGFESHWLILPFSWTPLWYSEGVFESSARFKQRPTSPVRPSLSDLARLAA